ncbi:unnamed protein product [Amoebophrya sp. A25]|nr:unnamed protein product [Amoebophrya sp. A25]|eukprot:GSA25T00014631001.1
MAEAAPQAAALAAMQVMGENMLRQAAVHESEGLGIATGAQIASVVNACENIRHKCTSQQYPPVLRQRASRTYEKLTHSPQALNLHPMALAAALGCADILKDRHASAIMGAVSRAITGSLDLKADGMKAGVSSVCEIFMSTLRSNLQGLALVEAGADLHSAKATPGDNSDELSPGFCAADAGRKT